MTLTYVDAGVLIVAARGGEARSERALALLLDAGRTFAASAFLRLEESERTRSRSTSASLRA